MTQVFLIGRDGKSYPYTEVNGTVYIPAGLDVVEAMLQLKIEIQERQ